MVWIGSERCELTKCSHVAQSPTWLLARAASSTPYSRYSKLWNTAPCDRPVDRPVIRGTPRHRDGVDRVRTLRVDEVFPRGPVAHVAARQGRLGHALLTVLVALEHRTMRSSCRSAGNPWYAPPP